MDPCSPINDEKIPPCTGGILFGGSLGQYRRCDMDVVVLSTLELSEKEKEGTI